ncbi:protein boule-like [Caerostris extrusa]|uniref:Protein boule-like n=1 Tax=Caerostris extrusa TaxID=172846 RepID=A0AAV4PET3_CAEEX|nr:protein boule-like [Caerostris extrusa]
MPSLNLGTTGDDLRNLFSKFGTVKATKVLFDESGISRGYGFVTFETEDDADKVLKQAERFILKDRKLNIGPAPRNQALEPNTVPNAIIWPVQTPSRASTEFSRESVYYPQTHWPLMWPQLYLQQQCPYPFIPSADFPQYMYPVAPDFPYQPISGSDYSETSSADSGESVKNRSKPSTSTPISSDSDRGRAARMKQSDAQSSNVQKYSGTNVENPPPTCMHSNPIPHLQPSFFAKTLNGVTVFQYPSSMVMGNPAIFYVKHGNESDNVLTDLGYLHSPMTSGTLTPPTTPLVPFPYDFNANTPIDSARRN